MTPTPPAEPANSAAPTPSIDPSAFLQRMKIATYSAVLFVLTIQLLKDFREMLQPLFVALFLGFLMHPVHRWLIGRGIPSIFAYGIIVILVVLGFLGFGSIMYANVAELARNEAKLRQYEDRLDTIIRNVVAHLPFKKEIEADKKEGAAEPGEAKGRNASILRGIFEPERLIAPAVAAATQLKDSVTWAALVFLFVLFLIAEKVTFPHRIALAFGDQQGERVMGIVESINQAISQYIAVKTVVSLLAGLLSYAVLAYMEVELAASWGILIFLLNYIPYVGSLIACALPILLSFLQFDEIWRPIVIAVSLIGIQQGIGNWIEPRMAGQRLDVSPLLIVLSLTFWWTVWGIFGAILAVPLLVIVRIILDNIPETKPIATLISNR
jgi:predicted PurR-regulated permease PerM